MKNWKKILGLGLSAALLTGVLAGCNQTGETPSPTSTAGAEGDVPLVQTEDMAQKFLGVSADTVMFTVDGSDVTAGQYSYWLASSIDNVRYYLGDIDWDAKEGDTTLKGLIQDDAKQAAVFYQVVADQAAAQGVTLSDLEHQQLQTQYAAGVEQYGAEEYAKQLQQMCLSDAYFRQVVETGYLFQSLQEKLFGEGGEMAATDEQLIAAAEEQGLMLAKHILISKKDATGADLSEADAAAAKTKAEDLLSQLRAVSGDAQVELFDALMNEHSADGRNSDGTLAAAAGYLFGAGEMVPEFEAGAKALEYGQISDLVETDYGYHIILRLTPADSQMRQRWNNEKLSEVRDGWMAEAQVVDSPALAQVDPQDFYEQLNAYRESLQPVPTEPALNETPPPSTTPAPTQTPEAEG